MMLPTGQVNTVVRSKASDGQSTGIFVAFLKMLQCGSKCNSTSSASTVVMSTWLTNAFMDSSDGTVPISVAMLVQLIITPDGVQYAPSLVLPFLSFPSGVTVDTEVGVTAHSQH